MKRTLVVVTALAVVYAVPSIAKKAGRHDEMRREGPGMAAVMAAPRAVAVLHPASGSQVSGTVTFIPLGNKVEVIANVQGLPPNSSHGFHIHEKGDCSAPDASSAGAHFNPESHQHGGPNSPMHHAGDLGNLEADANGKAYKRMTVDGVTLGSGPTSILGRGVIVHEKLDDFTTQPSGNAGARIACGEVTATPGATSATRKQ